MIDYQVMLHMNQYEWIINAECTCSVLTELGGHLRRCSCSKLQVEYPGILQYHSAQAAVEVSQMLIRVNVALDLKISAEAFVKYLELL
jgi:hypothetical protein